MGTYKNIDSALKEPEKVKKLHLNNQQFDKFPVEIFKCINLEELTFEWCKLKSIPPEIVKLPHLKSFNLFACWISKIPQEIFLIPNLEQGSIEETGKKEHQVLMKYINTIKPSLFLREALVAFLYENQPMIDKCSVEQMTGVLNVPIAALQLAAKKEIEKRSDALFKNSLPVAKSRMVLSGKSKTGNNILSDRLKSIGIEVEKKVTSETNYIVICEKPGEIIFNENCSPLVITENQVLSFLNEQKVTDNNEIKDNLLKLLHSSDRSNNTIAFELINRHGLPEGLITNLFACWAIRPDKSFRDRAKDALNVHGSPALQKLLTKTYNFKSVNEVKLSELISEFDKKTEINGLTLAKALYNNNLQGKKYLLENGDAETRMEVVKSMVKDKSVSFAMMRLTKFPEEILAFSNLKKISFRTGKFNIIPEELGNLSDLEVLDLGATSNVKEFPDAILKLKNLKYLSLNYTRYELPEQLKTLNNLECLEIMNRDMKELPEWLADLPSLRYLNIMGNHFSNNSLIPEVLFKLTSLEELSSSYNVYGWPEFSKLENTLSKTKLTGDEKMIELYY